MAEWKKVITSGSSAVLSQLAVDGTVAANAFSGDGSGLTGVAAGSINIDGFSAGTVLDQADVFLYSDGGTEKKITFSNIEDELFGNVSGDATIAAGGALTIANTSVTNDMLAGSIANAKLANSGITIAGSSTSLGGSVALEEILAGSTVVSSSMSVTTLSDVTSAGSGDIITSGERTKLSNIETSADVTDTTNVTAAGALMDSEVTNLSQVKAFDSADYATAAQGTTADNALPASSVSTFGGTLIDDANAGAARTTLGVDAAGTDNSTDVTIASGKNYVTISGQELTLGTVDISDDTNLAVGTGVTLSGDTLSIGQAVGTSDNVTFANITATGDLTVQGTLTSLQTTNLNIEDQFILLNSGSADAQSQGIIFGGSTGAQGAGEAFFYDLDADRPAWSSDAVAWNATDTTETAFIPRVFDVDGSSHTPIAEVGSIQISGGEILIYA